MKTRRKHLLTGILSILFGILLLVFSGWADLISTSWFDVLILNIAIGLGFITVIIVGVFRRGWFHFYIFSIVIIGLLFINLFDFETLKSPAILKATLDDDRSRIDMTLRKNNEFEVVATTIFTTDKFSGKYKLDKNAIIFLDRPYDSDFIPDTVHIIENKIILQMNGGIPDTSFANFFSINKLPPSGP